MTTYSTSQLNNTDNVQYQLADIVTTYSASQLSNIVTTYSASQLSNTDKVTLTMYSANQLTL